MNKVDINKNTPKTFLFPYLSANIFDKPIPIIINIIPPALNNPKPAETGSLPKKFIPILEKKSIMGEIKSLKEFFET